METVISLQIKGVINVVLARFLLWQRERVGKDVIELMSHQLLHGFQSSVTNSATFDFVRSLRIDMIIDQLTEWHNWFEERGRKGPLYTH